MSYLIYFLLFLLPFVVLPFGASPFESPKILGAEIGIILLILWYLSKYSIKAFLQKKYIPFGLLFFLGFIHLFLNPSPTLFLGNAFRQQGLFLFWLLLLFSLISSRIKFHLPNGRTVVLLLGLQLFFALIIQGKIDFRAVGTLGEANSLAGYAVCMVPLLFFPSFRGGTTPESLKKGKLRDSGLTLFSRMTGNNATRIIGVVLAATVILFSGSRSGVIALCILGAFYFIQRFSLKAAVIICFALMALSLSLPFLEQHQQFENRATIWQTAVAAGIMKPVFGWGLGNTEYALREGAGTLSNNVRFEYIDHTHNIFLEMFVTGGIIGLASFMYLIIMSFRNMYHERKTQEMAVMLSLLCMFSFNPLSVVLLLLLWFMIGRGYVGRLTV